MSTPTQKFSTLSLPDDTSDQEVPEGMRFENTTLEERKIIVRDIIACFEDHALPSEFRPEVWERITEEQGGRPRTDWTIPDDLKGSQMQWGCHDEKWWAALNSLRTPGVRALMFGQKLERRFEEQFKAYDTLEHNEPRGTAGELRTRMEEICEQLWAIVDAVADDLITRTGGQYNAAKILLVVLEKVCLSGRPDARPTLFRKLIRDDPRYFILDALDIIQERRPRSLGTAEAQSTMARINELLIENGAPQGYLTRFQSFSTE